MKTVKIPGDTNALVDELRTIRERSKKDEKREKEIVTKLKDVAEQQSAMLYFNKDIVAMVEAKSANRIDADKLRADYPDVAKECTVASTYLTVKCC